ncbi:MAG TPA: hypothetical protein VHU81_00625 [Thermoanaerobaculia bacterium]|nr:hypothetical protein [Thermoanaerobaculia bacterium]
MIEWIDSGPAGALWKKEPCGGERQDGVRTDPRAQENDMKKLRRMIKPSELSEIQNLTPGRVTAAGEIPDADLNPGTEQAGLFTLKMHVDNPGQTPM